MEFEIAEKHASELIAEEELESNFRLSNEDVGKQKKKKRPPIPPKKSDMSQFKQSKLSDEGLQVSYDDLSDNEKFPLRYTGNYEDNDDSSFTIVGKRGKPLRPLLQIEDTWNKRDILNDSSQALDQGVTVKDVIHEETFEITSASRRLSNQRQEYEDENFLEIMISQFNEMKNMVNSVNKKISKTNLILLQNQIASMLQMMFPDWNLLWPYGETQLDFSIDSISPEIRASFLNLFRSTHTINSNESIYQLAFPREVGSDGLFKFQARNLESSQLSCYQNSHWGPLQNFNYVVVVGILTSDDVCSSSDRFERYINSGSDEGSKELLLKFLELERFIWTLNDKFGVKGDAFIQLVLVVSQSFQFKSQEHLKSLANSIFTTYTLTFPELFKLFQKEKLMLIHI
ncbi:hypothetical protein HK096_006367 [Nowakowskiella sp. JEL0078]|nr:hypothetical protein HK096_006367 [Nowakowskiella sp. JEL0078]